MGIDTVWKQIMKKHWPEAWTEDIPYRKAGIHTVIDDFTLAAGKWLYEKKNPPTRRVIRDIIRSRVISYVKEPTVSHYVVLMDDPDFVTKAKEQLQRTRTMDIDNENKDKGKAAKIGDEDGDVMDMDVDGDGGEEKKKDEDEEKEKKPRGMSDESAERFACFLEEDAGDCIDAVEIRISNAGKRALQAFIGRIIYEVAVELLLEYPEKVIYIDGVNIEPGDEYMLPSPRYSDTPVMLEFHNVNGRVKPSASAIVVKGEADVKVAFHVTRVNTGAVLVVSNDSDSIPILLLCIRDMIHRTEDGTGNVKAAVFLDTRSSQGEKPPTCLDVVTLWRIVHDGLSVIHGIDNPIEFFVAVMLITGCDFLPKPTFRGITANDVWNTLRSKRWRELAPVTSGCDHAYGDPMTRHYARLDEGLFARFICAVYAVKFKEEPALRVPAGIRNSLENKLIFMRRADEQKAHAFLLMSGMVMKYEPRRVYFPSLETLSMIVRQINYVLNYWKAGTQNSLYVDELQKSNDGLSIHGYTRGFSSPYFTDDNLVCMTTAIHRPVLEHFIAFRP